MCRGGRHPARLPGVRGRHVHGEAGTDRRGGLAEGGVVTRDELEAEFLRMAAAGELDKIQRMLRSRRDRVPREVVKDIVQEACLEVIRRQQAGGVITNVAGLIVTIGGRMLEKAWQKMLAGYEVDAAFARREREIGEWRHDEQRQAGIDRAVDYVFKAVANWPADNHRRTLLMIIEAAAEGVQLEARDLDERLGCARGTGRVWRDRAFDRLRAQLEREGVSWEEVTDLLPDTSGDDPGEGDDAEEEQT